MSELSPVCLHRYEHRQSSPPNKGINTHTHTHTHPAKTQERAPHPTASESQSATVGAIVGGGSSKVGKEGNYSMTGVGTLQRARV